MSKVLFSMIKSGCSVVRGLTKGGIKPLNLAAEEKQIIADAFQKAFKGNSRLSAALAGLKSDRTLTLGEVLAGGTGKAAGEVKGLVAKAAGKPNPEPISIPIYAKWYEQELKHAEKTGTPVRTFTEIWKEHFAWDKLLDKFFAKAGLKRGTSLRTSISERISKALAEGDVPTISREQWKQLSPEVRALLEKPNNGICLVARDASEDAVRVTMSASREPMKIRI